MSRGGQFAMYFVGHHRHVVAEGDFADLHQFLPCPHPSGGIVGIAEQHHFYPFVGGFPFQVFEIDAVGMVFVNERVACRFAAVVADGGEEAVVDGRLHQYFVARHGQGLDDGGHGRHYAGGINHPLLFNGPSVSAFEPCADGFVILIGHPCVTEDAVSHAVGQGFRDGGSRTEVHVRHP